MLVSPDVFRFMFLTRIATFKPTLVGGSDPRFLPLPPFTAAYPLTLPFSSLSLPAPSSAHKAGSGNVNPGKIFKILILGPTVGEF